MRKKFVKFIIEKEESGKEKTFTCDGKKLANFFGANPEAPNYLHRVFFNKDVLDKYYSSPEKYALTDAYLLSSDHVWGMPLDNNTKENVMAYLGDLGMLPYEEQQHWRLHNIANGNFSEVSYKRDFKAEPANPSNPAEYFKIRIKSLNRKWKEKNGWDLFKPLNKEDEHHIQTLRLPKSQNQKEFDEQVNSISKIMIDSLNVEEMNKLIKPVEKQGSINTLSNYLEKKFRVRFPEMISFLKSLWEIRGGAAHRKGKDYSEIYAKLDKGDFSKTFENILVEAITTLNTLERVNSF